MPVTFSGYRAVLAVPSVRGVLALSMLVRVPMFASMIAVTLHVVGTLHQSYGMAGLLTAVSTVSIAVAGPWRGRLLDRIGLRRTLTPSLLVQAVCWSVAPFVGFWPLAVFFAVGGLLAVPTFPIVRQVLIANVPSDMRRTALALDSALTEVAYMAGPLIGVWAATTFDTRLAFLALEWASLIGALALWYLDPPLRHDDSEAAGGVGGVRSWMTTRAVVVLGAAGATMFILGGVDVAVVAALRSMGHPTAIGWVLAGWGLGSMVGGLLYGAWHRAVPVFWLLLALGALTVPVAWATSLPAFAVLLLVGGALVAPSITATVDTLSRVVPSTAMGEAMGWHGTAFTVGIAAGAPVGGFVIDHFGWAAGFAVTGAVGVVVGTLGLLGVRTRQRRPLPA